MPRFIPSECALMLPQRQHCEKDKASAVAACVLFGQAHGDGHQPLFNLLLVYWLLFLPK
jgi:hypothetical protein